MIATTRRWVRAPQRRPDQILDAALDRFAEDGYDATSVQDLASDAGVSVGTVYRYFPSKEHVLDGIHHRFHDGLEDAFESAVDQLRDTAGSGQRPGVAVVSGELVDATVGYLAANATACRVITTWVPRVQGPRDRESHDRRFVLRLTEVLEIGVGLGIVATSDPEMTARLLYAAMRDTVSHAIAFGDPPDLDRLVAQVRELFAKALAVR